eukprot:TRINITY_DN32016_c0_g1_i1.p1 TRINITY_DN32016_c0_g1~~TRINITY_DN32016_c0_g1_i1.p1  ORF type:complete len:564 (+),score=82.81 TRINITY_DN32016_c0_g1_i1:191-1693(+)
MAVRVAAIANHLVPSPCSAAPAATWPPQEPDRAFAGLKSPTGMTYKRGTTVSLMGNMEPVSEEVEGPLTTVHGQLPKNLDGFFIRTGPNPATSQYGNPKYHEFEGDGMLHAVEVATGTGRYMNRFVRTSRQSLEKEKGRPLKQHEKMASDGSYFGTANTALVYHAKQLLALYEVDRPYVISVPKLETLGQLTCEEALPRSVTAHPKVCPDTGELIYFGYAMMEPKVNYGVLDKNGKLLCSFELPTQGGKPVMMHDMAITQKFSVLLEFPLYFDMARAMQGKMPYVHDVASPSRFGIMPRHAKSADEIRWFTGKTAMSFHIANAWETGDMIRLIGCPQAKFSFDYGESTPSLLHEWVFDLSTGSTSERQLDGETHVEFPVINQSKVGKQSRYIWAAVFAGPGMPFHSICGCVKYDLMTGKRTRHDFMAGRWGGECVFAPTTDGTQEDDGYLLTYTYNPQDSTTELYVVDARTMDANPVAILKTPQRVPFGFHATWLSRSEM